VTRPPEPFREFVQIAGIADLEEARLLVACGVRYLGFPLRLPVHREDLPEAEAAAVVRAIQPPAYGVAITYEDDAREIAALLELLGASIVQLHGEIEPGELVRLRRLRPGVRIIKSLVVAKDNRETLRLAARDLAALVDAFITDTFDPSTGASGATGKTHDWSVSRELVLASPRPIILAGGLTPENVREAILTVGPAGVDAHTGVEGPDGRKDAARVRRFLAEAREGIRVLRASANGPAGR
jgi:phosphoribosylanthranilate isomerase